TTAPSGSGRATIACYSGVLLRRCMISRDCVVAFVGLAAQILAPALLLSDIIFLSFAVRKIITGSAVGDATYVRVVSRTWAMPSQGHVVKAHSVSTFLWQITVTLVCLLATEGFFIPSLHPQYSATRACPVFRLAFLG